MKVSLYLKRNIDKLIISEDADPINAAKKMVSAIQRLVGIHNVFGDKENRPSVLTILSAIVFNGSFLYLGTLSQSLYIVQVMPNKVETFKGMNCISSTCVPLSKNIFMWTSRGRLRTIIEMCRQGLSAIPTESKAHARILNTLTAARYVSWLVVLCNTFSHVIYVLLPLLFTIFGKERYLPTTPGEAYGLSPKYESPFYEATYFFTVTASFFSLINQSGYIVLFVTLLAHELGHCYVITEILNQTFHIISNDERTENVDTLKIVEDNLKFCVKHHQFLIKFHTKIRELYKIIFGAHFLMMIIVLVTTLQTLNAWDIRNTVLTAVTGITPLIIYCFGGEMLISAGHDLSQAVYYCGWQMMKVREAKITLLMLCLTQQPLHLTAADIFIMNRETFGNVVEFIYKIYAVFN